MVEISRGPITPESERQVEETRGADGAIAYDVVIRVDGREVVLYTGGLRPPSGATVEAAKRVLRQALLHAFSDLIDGGLKGGPAGEEIDRALERSFGATRS
jgi:hypothetical protein